MPYDIYEHHMSNLRMSSQPCAHAGAGSSNQLDMTALSKVTDILGIEVCTPTQVFQLQESVRFFLLHSVEDRCLPQYSTSCIYLPKLNHFKNNLMQMQIVFSVQTPPAQ